MNQTRRAIAMGAALCALTGTSAVFAAKDDDKSKDSGQGKAKKPKHKNGKDLLGDKIKKNGKHKIAQNGGHGITVDVKDGKIAAFLVKHDKKGDVAVKKYKTNKKMAALDAPQSHIVLVQYNVGTTWIGYSYIDDWGYEEIWWYPYDMILDGDTGAIEYVAAY